MALHLAVCLLDVVSISSMKMMDIFFSSECRNTLLWSAMVDMIFCYLVRNTYFLCISAVCERFILIILK